MHVGACSGLWACMHVHLHSCLGFAPFAERFAAAHLRRRLVKGHVFPVGDSRRNSVEALV